MEVLRGWQVYGIDNTGVTLISVGTPIEMYLGDTETNNTLLNLEWNPVSYAWTGRSDVELCGKERNLTGVDQTSTYSRIGTFRWFDTVCVGLRITANLGWYNWGPGNAESITYGMGTGYGCKGEPTFRYGAQIIGNNGDNISTTVPKLYFYANSYPYWWYGPENADISKFTNRVEGPIYLDTNKNSYTTYCMNNLRSGWGLKIKIHSKVGTSGEKSKRYGTFEGWEII